MFIYDIFSFASEGLREDLSSASYNFLVSNYFLFQESVCEGGYLICSSDATCSLQG